MAGEKVQKRLVQPINLIFRHFQEKTRVQLWLYEQTATRIEGQIIVCLFRGDARAPLKHLNEIVL
jgi:hypothetical protein